MVKIQIIGPAQTRPTTFQFTIKKFHNVCEEDLPIFVLACLYSILPLLPMSFEKALYVPICILKLTNPIPHN